jgi:hypothetical protein
LLDPVSDAAAADAVLFCCLCVFAALLLICIVKLFDTAVLLICDFAVCVYLLHCC